MRKWGSLKEFYLFPSVRFILRCTIFWQLLHMKCCFLYVQYLTALTPCCLVFQIWWYSLPFILKPYRDYLNYFFNCTTYFNQRQRLFYLFIYFIVCLFIIFIQVSDLQPARVVFDVSLEGRARKVVTIRSALMVKNKMDLPLEIKLQGLTSVHG